MSGSTWDPNSIMEYEFGPNLILEPEQYKNGLTPAGGISSVDEKWIKTWYPPSQDIDEIKLNEPVALKLQPGDGRQFSFIAPDSRQYDFQTFGESDTVMVLFEEVNGKCRVPKLFRIWFGPGPVLRDMKLNRKKVHWIIRQKQKGVRTKEIARDMEVSRRRVQQIWKSFQETGREPVLGKNLGRPLKPYDRYEAEIVRAAHDRYGFGARMLEGVIRKLYKVRISHNRIHIYLKAEGLAREELGKKKRRNLRHALVTFFYYYYYLPTGLGEQSYPMYSLHN